MKVLKRGLPWLLLLQWAGVAVAADPVFVSGLRPDRRPEGFPSISVSPPVDVAAALTGIPAADPAAFGWLASQGAWFTPFVRPGMPGPYDVRGWHRRLPRAGQ